jgi:hypothetical protein
MIDATMRGYHGGRREYSCPECDEVFYLTPPERGEAKPVCPYDGTRLKKKSGKRGR